MRALRVLLALLGGVAALCGGAWAGGALPWQLPAAHAASGRPSRATSELAYSGAGEIPVADSLEVNGQPMQLSIFYTADTPRKVVEFYGQAFIDRGLAPMFTREPPMEHVAIFDPADGLQRFITAVPQSDGQTMVTVGITNPRKPPRLLRGARSAGFPVPDEHRAFLGYRSDDQGTRAETGQYVTPLSVAETVAFYRERLGKDGWVERKDDSSDGLTLFARGDETLTVAAQALDAKQGAAVFVSRILGGAR